ncbi:trypsin-like peptidase domain-containing protein [Gracilibacillus sp. S3-1-1]|uniref:Trypsin-like peptidase domain-containing protein n=1 Tax=Gracilibacillus pellucidus TaxID=3095368 RepID=A0ACC6M344_9BACI|nr:trypsin-like peptidase domain-containing protein [Gracilibacillus sp. S3-1-1]MDX8045316.1 trypsin-like peptidase domain-containing protein [Gracilibacillus sp. S3-1-1]
MNQKKSLLMLLLSLVFACMLPVAVGATTPTDEAYDSVGQTELDEEQVPQFEEKYEEDKDKLPEVIDYDSSTLEELTEEHSEFTSVSSQGDLLDGPATVIEKNFDDTLNSIGETMATDNRVRINNTTSSPYNAMAHIVYASSDGNWFTCSGTFLDSNTVLTAAHCVYDNYANEYYQLWYVYPGADGANQPYGGYSSTDAYTTLGWMNSQAPQPGSIYFSDVQHDYAVIKVNSNHSHTLPVSSSSYRGDSILAHGYPAELADANGYYLFRSEGAISDVTSDTLVHTSYITGGMSGGPILNNNNIISVNSTSSWGPQLTPSHVQVINQWRAN